jgi:hypothetical protein
MEKDYKNINHIPEAATNDVASKPENEIKAELVSVEVVGEDTPPKHSNKYEAWGVIALLSLVVWVICLTYFAFNNQSVNCLLVLIGSSALFFYSIGQMSFIGSDERIGNTI